MALSRFRIFAKKHYNRRIRSESLSWFGGFSFLFSWKSFHSYPLVFLQSIEVSEKNRIIRIEDALGQPSPSHPPSFFSLHSPANHGVVTTSDFGSFVTLPKEHRAWALSSEKLPLTPNAHWRKSGSALFPNEEIVLSEQVCVRESERDWKREKREFGM